MIVLHLSTFGLDLLAAFTAGVVFTVCVTTKFRRKKAHHG